MKQVRDLLITSKEGFSVKNLKRFPSMEYGEDGGLEADLYYKGDKVMTVYDAGDGGCASCSTTELFSMKTGEIKDAALRFLKRCDENYGVYDFLKKKKAKDVDDDDFECVVNLIEERFDDYKRVAKSFKDGFKAVAVLKNNIKTYYLSYHVIDVTEDEVNDYLTKNNLKYKINTIVRDPKELLTL